MAKINTSANTVAVLDDFVKHSTQDICIIYNMKYRIFTEHLQEDLCVHFWVIDPFSFCTFHCFQWQWQTLNSTNIKKKVCTPFIHAKLARLQHTKVEKKGGSSPSTFVVAFCKSENISNRRNVFASYILSVFVYSWHILFGKERYKSPVSKMTWSTRGRSLSCKPVLTSRLPWPLETSTPHITGGSLSQTQADTIRSSALEWLWCFPKALLWYKRKTVLLISFYIVVNHDHDQFRINYLNQKFNQKWERIIQSVTHGYDQAVNERKCSLLTSGRYGWSAQVWSAVWIHGLHYTRVSGNVADRT